MLDLSRCLFNGEPNPPWLPRHLMLSVNVLILGQKDLPRSPALLNKKTVCKCYPLMLIGMKFLLKETIYCNSILFLFLNIPNVGRHNKKYSFIVNTNKKNLNKCICKNTDFK